MPLLQRTSQPHHFLRVQHPVEQGLPQLLQSTERNTGSRVGLGLEETLGPIFFIALVASLSGHQILRTFSMTLALPLQISSAVLPGAVRRISLGKFRQTRALVARIST